MRTDRRNAVWAFVLLKAGARLANVSAELAAHAARKWGRIPAARYLSGSGVADSAEWQGGAAGDPSGLPAGAARGRFHGGESRAAGMGTGPP